MKLVACAVFVAALFAAVPAFFPAFFNPNNHLNSSSQLPDNAVYIWQRLWTPELVESLYKIAPQITQVRILAAELSAQGKWAQTQVDITALNATGLPVYAVMRIDGRNPQLLSAHSQQDILRYLARWRAQVPQLKGLEIDYDCPESQLHVYSQFLHSLRANLPASVALSNTLLPSWLESPILPAVLAQSDESVLQVHAVSRPTEGLFNAQQALQWVKDLQRLTTKPFRVALPAYGSRVSFGADGKIVAITSEQRRWDNADDSLELEADPQVLADFLTALSASNKREIIWFRLPSASDERSWPLTTLLAVIAGQKLQANVDANLVWDDLSEAETAAHPAQNFTRLVHLQLVNNGNIAAAFPAQVEVLANGCNAADGVNLYRAMPAQKRWVFTTQTSTKLLPQQRQAIGWLRCPAGINRDELHIVVAQH